MRLISTVVLPLPAPAKINSGPPTWNTAWRCWGFKKSYSLVRIACFFVKYCDIPYSFSFVPPSIAHSGRVFNSRSTGNNFFLHADRKKRGRPNISLAFSFTAQSSLFAAPCLLGAALFLQHNHTGTQAQQGQHCQAAPQHPPGVEVVSSPPGVEGVSSAGSFAKTVSSALISCVPSASA